MHSTQSLLTAVGPLLLVALAACGSTAPSRFYVLSPTAAAQDASVGELVVGVELVSLPGSVDRPQIVTALSPHERRFSEFERWAEPLRTNVARVLEQDLKTLLGLTSVYRLPSRWMPRPDYRVGVEILVFQGVPGGVCMLEARWHLADGDLAWIASHQASFEAACPGDDDVGFVEAMSRNLGALSAAIAASIASRPAVLEVSPG